MGVEVGPVVRMGCCSSVVETAVVDDSIKETGGETAGLLTEEVNRVGDEIVREGIVVTCELFQQLITSGASQLSP